MKASAWTNGNGTYGVRVGIPNRNEFFSPEWAHVLIEIEGEFHQIKITGGFWNQCPEIRAPVIREWLGKHRTLSWPKGQPPTIELVPLGGNRFRLTP